MSECEAKCENKKIIIDTDIGDDIDDAFALSMLANCSAQILGVTTVYKNSEERARIAAYLLGKWGICCPVAAGQDYPIREPMKVLEFERLCSDGRPHISQLLPEMECAGYSGSYAADLILDSARRYPGQVTLLALGPMTNLAQARRQNPAVFEQIGEILMMGGSVRNDFAEWNIRCDSEAAAEVFESGVPIRMVGVDVTFGCVLDGDNLRRIEGSSREGAEVLRAMTRRYVGAYSGKRSLVMHDPLTAGVLFGDFVKFRRMKLRVGTQGCERGKTLPCETGKECLVAESAAYDAFLDFMTDAIVG
ncbi:MAG TPA: nucleoside hydrolase [Firmicutes bacterium]|nr:nucleoside hydrolase [Bacillota bacterium]